MIWVDWCILAVMLISILFGIFRGFSREILNLLTWALAFLLAWLLGPWVANLLHDLIAQAAVRSAVAHAGLFMTGLLIGSLITHFFTDWVRNSVLNDMDRTLGGGFGFLRGLLVVSAFMLVAGTLGANKDRWWQHSLLLPHMEWLADGLGYLTPESWLQKLKSGESTGSIQSRES